MLLLALAAGLALFVRVWLPYHAVLGGPFVRFTGTDPWYHLRLAENAVRHFPHRLWYDPFRLFGPGQPVTIAPLFDLIIAAAALVLGAGHPSPALVEHVAAWVPAVMGAACVLPAYALGRVLFSRRAGLFAAALTAVLPGQFLARTSLGYTDHHAAEALFSACALAFFVHAVARPSSAAHARRWTPALLAGVFLGAYLDSWTGGVLLVLIFTTASALALVVCPADGEAALDVTAATGLTFCMAALLVLPFVAHWNGGRADLPVLGAALAGIVALAALRRTVASVHLSRWVLAAGACVLLAAAAAGLEWVAPGAVSLVRGGIERLRPSTGGPPVGEAMSLLALPLSTPFFGFLEFGPGFYLALGGAIAILRRLDAGRLVLLTMFVVAAGLTVREVRFAYYLGIPVAVLAGYVCDAIMVRAGRRAELAFLVLIAVVFVPSAQLVRASARTAGVPSDDWYEALTWLRTHSPEPFGSPDIFDADQATLVARHRSAQARSYAVTSWWDSGYWITEIAHRLPSDNPTQIDAGPVASALIATDIPLALSALVSLHSRYVIVDDVMLPRWIASEHLMAGTLQDMLVTARHNPDEYYEVYTRRGPTGALQPVLLYYPAYYQTFGIRLYAFDGRAVQPRSAAVALFHEAPDGSGGRRKMLDALMSFSSTAVAEAFIRGSTRPARLVGTDPLVSCVPLEPLPGIALVHTAPAGTVKIFAVQNPS